MLSLLAATVFAKGDHWVHERTWRWVNEAEGIHLVDVERVEHRVLSVAPAVVVERSRKLVKSLVGKDEVPASPGLEAEKTRLTLRAGKGFESIAESAEGMVARVDRVADAAANADGFGKPRWQRKFEGEVGGLPESSVLFVVRKRTGDELLCEVSYRETGLDEPFRMHGAATVDVKTQMLKGLELRMPNVAIPGGTEQASLTISQKLVEFTRARK